MFGAETLDHVAFPVRDLARSEKFYIDTVGLTFLTQRKNADGSPRHTYVKAGENIIGLNLPGIQADPSPSGAPRYAIILADISIKAIAEASKGSMKPAARPTSPAAPGKSAHLGQAPSCLPA